MPLRTKHGKDGGRLRQDAGAAARRAPGARSAAAPQGGDAAMVVEPQEDEPAPEDAGSVDGASLDQRVAQAAKLLAGARALLVVVGAGMGVDSGLDSFRTSEGHYTLEDYHAKCQHALFLRDPESAWAFHGAALRRVREATPHEGFARLLDICRSRQSHFVVTSNVDGHFEKAGFQPSRVFNAHGSLHLWQCVSSACNRGRDPWPAGDWDPRCVPRCKFCGKTARPNASLFDDNQGSFQESLNGRAILAQYELFEAWLRQTRGWPLCILEIGCGESEHSLRLIPKDRGRWACTSDEWGLEPLAGALVRIDPSSQHGAPTAANFAHIPLGARDALGRLADALGIQQGATELQPPRRSKGARRR